MNEKYKKFITHFAYCSITVFIFIFLITFKGDIHKFKFGDLFGVIEESIGLSTILMFLYEKKLWRINPFENTPKLYAKYDAKLRSNYDGKERDITIKVKQTLLSIHIILISNESKSHSIVSSLEFKNEEWVLTYCYQNTPRAKVRNKSEIHNGTAVLCINSADDIEGQYYTDRGTTGDMWFKKISKGDNDNG